MLGAPDEAQPSWMAVGFSGDAAAQGGGRAGDILFLTEEFARETLPRAAVDAMRAAPCFHVQVESLVDAVARTPGRVIGEPVEALGLRSLCVMTAHGLMILAEQA